MASVTRAACAVTLTLGAAASAASAEPTTPAALAALDVAAPLVATAPGPLQAPRLRLDNVEFRLDRRSRRANLSLHGGGDQLSVRLDSVLGYARGAATIDTRLELAVGGRHLTIDLPVLELAPRSYRGESYLELRVPIIRRPF